MGEKLRVGFYVGILLSEIVFISVGIAFFFCLNNLYFIKEKTEYEMVQENISIIANGNQNKIQCIKIYEQ